MIDRVRVDEANRLQDDRPQLKVVKRFRWLLLCNRENVPPAQQAELWQTSGGWQWLLAWRNWLKMARDSGIEPLRKFAAKLKSY